MRRTAAISWKREIDVEWSFDFYYVFLRRFHGKASEVVLKLQWRCLLRFNFFDLEIIWKFKGPFWGATLYRSFDPSIKVQESFRCRKVSFHPVNNKPNLISSQNTSHKLSPLLANVKLSYSFYRYVVSNELNKFSIVLSINHKKKPPRHRTCCQVGDCKTAVVSLEQQRRP